jgi:hypothetical protein
VMWSTSRWPMSFEANSEVPPCSLAEQRKITVVPQFSTIVSAVPLPWVVETWAMDWKPRTERPPKLRRRARPSFRPSIAPSASSSSIANP